MHLYKGNKLIFSRLGNKKVVFLQLNTQYETIMIRSLFFDIDGTLCSLKTHEIPESAVRAITEAKARGVKIFISTGRPIQIINNIGAIEHLVDGYITTNGAYCFVGDTAVCCMPIPAADVRTLTADAMAEGYPCIVAGDKGIAVYGKARETIDRIFRGELNVSDLDFERPAGEVLCGNVLQVTSFCSSEHEQKLMERIGHCVSARWHPAFTDITADGADKGKGLAAMARHFGLDISETMAFGDGGNDISIIRRAGTGVAMGNAGDNVKAAADYVTTSVDDDGVMNALVHFGVVDK